MRFTYSVKKRYFNNLIRPLQIFFILCALCVLCGENTAQDFKTIHDGVEYAQVEHKLGNDPAKINLLRLDLTKVRLDVHHAMDSAIGTEKTSSMANRHGAVAAINAGFFRLDTSPFAGEASDVLKIDGRLLSEGTRGRIALAISNGPKRSSVFFAHATAWIGLGTNLSDEGTNLDGINREPKPDEVVLFTPGVTIPDMSNKYYGLILRNCRKECDGEIAEVLGIRVPENGFVLIFGPEAEESYLINWIKKTPGPKRTFRIQPMLGTPQLSVAPLLMKAEDVVAGVPQLIKNGKIDITWEQEKASRSFAEMRHPRTAVAKLKDGKFLMMTVDGRQPG